MVFFGVLSMLLAAGAGGALAWQNRQTIVRVHIGDAVWTGHLYAVIVVGALLAWWFMLGAAFIQCRIAERRRGKQAAAHRAVRARREATQRAFAGRR